MGKLAEAKAELGIDKRRTPQGEEEKVREGERRTVQKLRGDIENLRLGEKSD